MAVGEKNPIKMGFQRSEFFLIKTKKTFTMDAFQHFYATKQWAKFRQKLSFMKASIKELFIIDNNNKNGEKNDWSLCVVWIPGRVCFMPTVVGDTHTEEVAVKTWLPASGSDVVSSFAMWHTVLRYRRGGKNQRHYHLLCDNVKNRKSSLYVSPCFGWKIITFLVAVWRMTRRR